MIINNTKTLHHDKVKSLAEKYVNEGFDVVIEPKMNQLQLPFNLGNYQPDIIATKNNSGLVIDVKTSTNRVSVENLQAISEEISRHPDWRFLLVTLEDIEAESLPGTSEELPSWEELIDHFSQVGKLIKNNDIEPAFLFLWSVFEGALRKKAVDVSIPIERLPAIKLLRSMYSLGELSISEFDIIQACLEERNRMAHGYIQKLNLEVLANFVKLVVVLLCEWIPDIYISLLSQTVASMKRSFNETKAQEYQKCLEIVASVLQDVPTETKDRTLAAIKEISEQEGLTTNFNDLQLIVYEYCDISTESNNQQINKNKIVLDDNAQIALDALPTQEKEKISHAISYLEKFPNCSEMEVSKLDSISGNFIAKSGIYRIIFEVQSEKVTIVDIVNYNRIEMAFK